MPSDSAPHDATVTGEVALRLLRWYDAHARDLPWRVGPAARAAGVWPDPYRVWLSEIMLQQTTVATVKSYFEKFTSTWPDVNSLAASPRDDVLSAWAGLGYYARARNLHACAQVVATEWEGMFPGSEAELLTLPGIGRYTAAAIASIAFDQVATVVDGNVERVMARLHAVEEPLPKAKSMLYTLAAAQTPTRRTGDYAQAVMDLGATVCTPRNPSCDACPVSGLCAAHEAGIAATLPRKMPKKVKPTRHGICYLARREDGAVLLTTRPDEGLLGGMAELPGGDWVEGNPTAVPPLDAAWHERGEVRHTFTHFHLILRVMQADVAIDATTYRGRWTPVTRLDDAPLPTVMRKALACGSDQGRLPLG
jgi:A/G-specific adenine glycosylase